MNDIENKFKIIDRYVWALYIVLGIVLGIYNIFYSTPYYIMLSFASILFLAVPYIIYHILKLKTVYIVNFAIYLFCFFAFTIGMVFNGYSCIPYFDKFVHTISGIFFTLLGLGLYYVLKPVKIIDKNDYSLGSFFSIFFSSFVAVIWEIYEYIIDFILHTDPQRVTTTGINDTMQDMIVCIIGSFIMWIFIYLYYKKDKTTFLMSVFENFFNINMKTV